MAHGLERVPDSLGYLILNEEGAVIGSAGDLENEEKLAEKLMSLIRTAVKLPITGDKISNFKRLSVSGTLQNVRITQPNDTLTKMPDLVLPFIGQMAIKYGYTHLGRADDKFSRTCDRQGEIYNFVTCRLEPLLFSVLGELSTTFIKVLGDSDVTHVAPKGTNDAFRSDFEYLCRFYDSVKPCLQGRQCQSRMYGLTHFGELLYEYICGRGKQDLMSIGPYLMDFDEKLLLKRMLKSGHCQPIYNDLSSTFQGMVALFQANPTAYPAAAKSYLNSLCKEWKTLKQCFLPAMNLGPEAASFYQGFIEVLRSDLRRRYEASTWEVLSLIDCGANSDHKQVIVAPTHHQYQPNSGLYKYYSKMSKKYHSLKPEPCSPEAIVDWMQFCLFNTSSQITRDGTNLVDIFSDVAKNAKVISKGFLHNYFHCVDMGKNAEHTSAMKIEACHNSIDFHPILKLSNKLLDILNKYPGCLADISVVVEGPGGIVNHGCGLTMSGMINFYVVQSTQIYMGLIAGCKKRNNVGSFHHVSCLKTSLTSVFANQIVSGNGGLSCVKEVVPVLDETVKALDELMEQTVTLYSQLQKSCLMGQVSLE